MCGWLSNAQHSCSAARFGSLLVDLFLALLSGLHIIEVFVPCGLSACLASFAGRLQPRCSVWDDMIHLASQGLALSSGKVALELYVGVVVE